MSRLISMSKLNRLMSLISMSALSGLIEGVFSSASSVKKKVPDLETQTKAEEKRERKRLKRIKDREK